MQFQDELFDSGREIFNLTCGWLILLRNLFDNNTADQLFFAIKEKTDWESGKIFIAGKYRPIPRLNAWYADDGKTYTYSGIELNPKSWYRELYVIKQEVNLKTDSSFNSCLLNLYRDGNDSVAWHCDDEPELGRNPFIASVSLGVERKFTIRSLNNKNDKLTLRLPHNSLLLMEGEVQHRYEHMIPKENNISGARVNLTFRTIL